MCEPGDTQRVRVWIPDDLSCDGMGHWKYAQIDHCIAPLVQALQRGGVDMRGSCCGHGKTVGSIELQDGRVLLILGADEHPNASALSSDGARSSSSRHVLGHPWKDAVVRR